MDPDSQSSASLELCDVGLEEEPHPSDADGAETRPLVRGADPEEEVHNPGRRARRPYRGGSRAAAAADAAASALSNGSILDAVSNESILGAAAGIWGGMSRAVSAARPGTEAAGTSGSLPGGVPGGERGSTTATSRPARSAFENPSDGSKRRLLLLMGTLTVALLGAVLAKDSALLYEEGVEEGEVSGVFHRFRRPEKPGAGKKGAGKAPRGPAAPDVSGYLPRHEVNATDYVLPGTESAPPLSAAKGRPYPPVLNHFQFRDPDSPYANRWGRFDLVDPDPRWRGTMRPNADFARAANRDVDNGDFPEGAWQADGEYMEAFLAEAKRLVNRSIEAVYGEYGVGLPEDGSAELDDEWSGYRDLFAPFTIKEGAGDPLPRGGGGPRGGRPTT